MPLEKVVKTVLSLTSDLWRVPVQSRAVRLEPLLDENPYRGGGQATEEAREPERIEPDRVLLSLELFCERQCVEGSTGGVDEGRVDGKALYLAGETSQNGVRLVCGRGLEKLI